MNRDLTPRMALAGKQKLLDLGYEGVEFTDAQSVFLAMVEASPSPIGRLNELDETREALGESRKVVSRVWAALGINTYDQAGGKAIDELVCHLREAVEFAHANGFEWPSDPIPWARNA